MSRRLAFRARTAQHSASGTKSSADRLMHAVYSAKRRDRLKAAGLCINSEKHGAATHGVLCADCRTRHLAVANRARGELRRLVRLEAIGSEYRQLVAEQAERVVIDTRRRA